LRRLRAGARGVAFRGRQRLAFGSLFWSFFFLLLGGFTCPRYDINQASVFDAPARADLDPLTFEAKEQVLIRLPSGTLGREVCLGLGHCGDNHGFEVH
jgi:hypothetical protein